VGAVLLAILALNTGTYFGLMRHDGKETLRFDTDFASQAGKRIVAEARARPGMAFLTPRGAIDRDVFPFFARMMGDAGSLAPLDGVVPALLWATGLERVPGNSPAGAGGVPAFIEYRTPG